MKSLMACVFSPRWLHQQQIHIMASLNPKNVWEDYLHCPHHRGMVMSLSCALQVITMCCPSALVWVIPRCVHMQHHTCRLLPYIMMSLHFEPPMCIKCLQFHENVVTSRTRVFKILDRSIYSIGNCSMKNGNTLMIVFIRHFWDLRNIFGNF